MLSAHKLYNYETDFAESIPPGKSNSKASIKATRLTLTLRILKISSYRVHLKKSPSMQAVAKSFRAQANEHSSNFCEQFDSSQRKSLFPPEGKTDIENYVAHSIPVISQHDLETEIMRITISYLFLKLS